VDGFTIISRGVLFFHGGPSTFLEASTQCRNKNSSLVFIDNATIFNAVSAIGFEHFSEQNMT
jgi:hypothetical protein